MYNTGVIKVAVLDDCPVICNSMQALLSRWGYSVVLKALDGMEFCGKLTEENHPDICIADINLRRDNGYVTMKILKEKLPQMKILVFGAIFSKRETENLLKAGADMYVSKADPLTSLQHALSTISNTINH
jgi:two-component system response regulator FimZ (fimbrial Z protein)/two-component system response regulator EvgA